MRTFPVIALSLFTAISSAPRAGAGVSSGVPSWAAAKVFDPGSLGPETVKAATLESLLGEQLKKVVEAAGARDGEFSSTVTVHVSKVRRSPPPRPAPRAPRRAGHASVGIDPTFGASFGSHSMLDADDLIGQFESLGPDQPPAPARAKTQSQGPGSTESTESKNTKDQYEYVVDDVYLQAALSDLIYDETHARVEKALHQSFDALIPGKLKIDVNPFSRDHASWLGKTLNWVRRLQWVAMETLLLLGAALLLLLFRLVPSWQSKQSLKTAHERKEEILHGGLRKDGPADPAEAKPGPASADPAPIAAGRAEEPAADPDEALWQELADVQGSILSFVAAHPGASEHVVAGWIKEQEPAAKISYFVEFLARHGHGVGKIELRSDQLKELRDYKRGAEKPGPQEQLKISKEAFWDMVSCEHFKPQPQPNPFQFAGFVDDQLLLAALRGESYEVQAQVIGALNEKRAAALIAKYPSAGKRRLMEIFFARGTGEARQSDQIASHLQEKLRKMASSHAHSLAGAEAMASLLSNLDFPSQFTAASGLISLGAAARSSVLRSYFNVALLPLAQPSFLEKVFVDRDVNFVKTILSQFDVSFVEAVKGLLPPMQQRMLDGADFSGISRGQAMTALKELNESISGQIRRGEIALEDIFAPGALGESDELEPEPATPPALPRTGGLKTA